MDSGVAGSGAESVGASSLEGGRQVHLRLEWNEHEPMMSVEHDHRGGVVVTADPRLSHLQVKQACAQIDDAALGQAIHDSWTRAMTRDIPLASTG